MGLPVERHWRALRGSRRRSSRSARNGPTRGATLEFDTDGVVIKVDDLALRERLGDDGEVPAVGDGVQVPRAAGAHETAEDRESTSDGPAPVTPYAVLEPVFVAGSTISMATLHNAEDLARKDLREGDTVVIEKAGDVIPKVVAPDPDASARPARTPWMMPTTCPECGSVLRRDEEEVVWRCENTSCPARIAAQPRALRARARR